jgi:dTDP-D-glucose 4,6-dehydratase
MPKKTILMFGGNGFIGSETVEYILDNNDDFDIILVNRGLIFNYARLKKVKNQQI